VISALINAFKIPELRKRLIFTLALLAVYEMGTYVPTPGIDGAALRAFFDDVARSSGGTLFDVMNLFSGGAMGRATVFALSIMPYITASIILQLLTAAIPSLKEMSQEELGRRKILQYTRYGTVALAFFQSFFIALWLENPESFGGRQIVQFPGWGFRLLAALTLTAGTAFIMWLGEQITERGIGNGISLVISASIIASVPAAASQLWSLLSIFRPEQAQISLLKLVFMIVILVAVVAAIVLLTEGQRRIPVQSARRVVGRKVYGGQSSYIPLRVNQVGVIPIIFAQSIMMVPATLASFIPSDRFRAVTDILQTRNVWYTVFYAVMIMFFAYFYAAITFDPVDVADNMKKHGSFVPGIRPGRHTAEYFDKVMTRVTFVGALSLAIIAVFPEIIHGSMKIPYLVASFFGGTGLLIVVGVMLDTMKQLESHLLMRNYEGFMRSGKVRGRR
jgi:preprotein translocase subunit SecY